MTSGIKANTPVDNNAYCQSQAKILAGFAMHASDAAMGGLTRPQEDKIMISMQNIFLNLKNQKCGREFISKEESASKETSLYMGVIPKEHLRLVWSVSNNETRHGKELIGMGSFCYAKWLKSYGLLKSQSCRDQARKVVDLALQAHLLTPSDQILPKENTIMKSMRESFQAIRRNRCGRAYIAVRSFEQERVEANEKQMIHGLSLYENWHQSWIKDHTFPDHYYKITYDWRGLEENTDVEEHFREPSPKWGV